MEQFDLDTIKRQKPDTIISEEAILCMKDDNQFKQYRDHLIQESIQRVTQQGLLVTGYTIIPNCDKIGGEGVYLFKWKRVL